MGLILCLGSIIPRLEAARVRVDGWSCEETLFTRKRQLMHAKCQNAKNILRRGSFFLLAEL